jgi:hypothetical protein
MVLEVGWGHNIISSNLLLEHFRLGTNHPQVQGIQVCFNQVFIQDFFFKVFFGTTQTDKFRVKWKLSDIVHKQIY